MTSGLRTGQVAEAAGVNIQTLRYYERRFGVRPCGERGDPVLVFPVDA